MTTKPQMINPLVRINPYWQLGDDPWNIVRHDAGLEREPDGWSVETGHLRSFTTKNPDGQYSMTTWHVEADFAKRADAHAAALGCPIITVSNAGPGGEEGFLLFEIVVEHENDRAFADWIEWGGYSEPKGLETLQNYAMTHRGSWALLDVAAVNRTAKGVRS